MRTATHPVEEDGQVQEARSRLEAERDQTLSRLATLTDSFDSMVAASLDTNADDEHDPEGATIAFERAQIGALVHQTRHHVAEIEAALQRLDAGAYGRCERCQEAIAEERLEARPVARTCLRCAAT